MRRLAPPGRQLKPKTDSLNGDDGDEDARAFADRKRRLIRPFGHRIGFSNKENPALRS